VWLNSQWYLHRALPPQFGVVMPRIVPEPEGKGTIACVWLTLSRKVGSRGLNLKSVLTVPAANNVPMAFMYGEGDKEGAEEATQPGEMTLAFDTYQRFMP